MTTSWQHEEVSTQKCVLENNKSYAKNHFVTGEEPWK